MSTQVDASTISAGQLFSTTTFAIPDYQREYSWTQNEQVKEFWQDLSNALDENHYFLGLLILTNGEGNKSVVDGQQRLITLSLLANMIRLQAIHYNRTLVAQTMRDMFLFTPNYEDETRNSRIHLTSDNDREVFESILSLDNLDSPSVHPESNIFKAHKYFLEKFGETVNADNAPLELSKWARLLSNGVNFALFIHPDANAAFKVFEVVNTRGKDLTPAQLIKSYLISSVPEDSRKDIFDRWVAIEEAFRSRDLMLQLTQFIRHSVILKSGYVSPRDLYQQITRSYPRQVDVEAFLAYLESVLPTYLKIADPYSDENEDDIPGRVFTIIDQLGVSAVRPILLAISTLADRDAGFEELLRIVVPRSVAGSFGTGGVERDFAKAAMKISESSDWQAGIDILESLRPPQEDFSTKLQSKSMNRRTAHVLRSSLIQRSRIPTFDTHIHLVRPRYAEWPQFTDDEFRLIGTTLGNYILSSEERRPHGTNSPREVKEKLIPTAPSDELVSIDNFGEWTADDVRGWNSTISTQLIELWYAEVSDGD